VRLGLSNVPLRAALALIVLSLATLPPPTGASHNDDDPVPIAAFVVVASDLGAPRGLVHHEGDRVLALTEAGELWSLNATHREQVGTVPLDVGNDLDPTGLDRDASGALLVDGWRGAHRFADGVAEPIVPYHDGFFGPDGRLYFIEPESRGDQYVAVLVAVDEVRRVERILELPFGYDAAFAPDGDLFVVGWGSGDVARVDLATRTWEHLGRVGGGLGDIAVDALGRLYVASGYYRSVERFDFATGEHVLLGEGISGATPRLVFAGTRLWVTTGSEGWSAPPHPNVVGYFETGVEGFSGFHPEFDLAPLPNLVLGNVEERILDESGDAREIVFTVTNEGGSWMGPGWGAYAHRATYESPSFGTCIRYSPTIEGCNERWIGRVAHGAQLAPGESVELVIPWDAQDALGAQHVTVEVNRAWQPFESTHDDNVASFRTYVKLDTPVGGL
jgi:hypothetical protein